MTLGAMVDAGLSIEKLKSALASLPVGGYELSAEKVLRCGVAATRVHVRLGERAHAGHRHYPDIMRIIEKSQLDPRAKALAGEIFTTLGRAEARVHNVALEKVHFHEVGAVDSIVDIVGAAIGFCELGIADVAASAVNTGHGTVNTEHGLLPVPAPATAALLMGVPTYAEGPAVELTTPTGAAIIKTMAKSFGPQPMMTVRRIGLGAGGMDFEDRPNLLRLFIGEPSAAMMEERLVELSTNIDDMNPQAFPEVSGMLFQAGALDVTLIPVQMKKGRPAIILSALARPEDRRSLERIILENTTTLGVRCVDVARVSLSRSIRVVETRFGPVEVKVARTPGGGERLAPEFESVRKAAGKAEVSFETVYWEAARMAGG
jgi:hypothetical protein